MVNSLVAEKCIIGVSSHIYDGCILDKEVGIKDGVVLRKGSVVSCITADPKSKDLFVRISANSDECSNGAFCQLPVDMTLEEY